MHDYLLLDATPADIKDEFAHDLGYASFTEITLASELMTHDRKQWYITPLFNGQWAGWNESGIPHVFIMNSREQVLRKIREEHK
jgi:hypothetical protein